MTKSPVSNNYTLSIEGNIKKGTFKDKDIIKYVDWNGNIKSAFLYSIKKRNSNGIEIYDMVIQINENNIDDSSILFIE